MFNSKYIKSLTAGLVLASGVFMSAGTGSAAKNFTDLASNPSHTQSVSFLNAINVFDYKTGNQLNGEQGVTRAEAAKVLHSLYKDAIDPVRTYNNNFKDVNGKTAYADAIEWAYESAILDGDTNGNFNPNKVLTRAQMAKILVNAFVLQSNGTYKFNDVTSSHWAYEYINILGSKGISIGSNGNFMPDQQVTLNQLSTFIYRILTNLAFEMAQGNGPVFEFTYTPEQKEDDNVVGVTPEEMTPEDMEELDYIFNQDKFFDDTTPEVTPQPEVKPEVTVDPAQFEAQVVELVNIERAKVGLAPLTVNATLTQAAHAKSQDMSDYNIMSHTTPTYGSLSDLMKAFGFTDMYFGENIAKGYNTPEKVVEAWMESDGHRANILRSNYTEIGVGYVAEGNYWTQLFMGQ